MSDQEYGWFGDMLTPENLEAFKEQLTQQELSRFEKEEDEINRARLELFKKYNTIASDRLTHQTLIDELKQAWEHCSPQLLKFLDFLDNTSLQLILSVMTFHKNETLRDVLVLGSESDE